MKIIPILNKFIYFFISIFLVINISAMQSMDIDQEGQEQQGKKRKHDAVYTIYQPDSLVKQAAERFSVLYIKGFKDSTTNNRWIRCKQFWEDSSDLPTDVMEIVFNSLQQVWRPAHIWTPTESVKFKTFALLLKHASANDRQTILINFFASEKAKSAFSDAMQTTNLEIISCKLFDIELQKRIIKTLSNESSLSLSTMLMCHPLETIQNFLSLGLNVQAYNPNTTNQGQKSQFLLPTALSYAIEQFNLAKINLLLQYNAAIPMASPTENAIIHTIIRGINDSEETRDKIIKRIIESLGKKLFIDVSNRRFIINKEETIVHPEECIPICRMLVNLKGIHGLVTSDYSVSIQATDIFTGNCFIPKSQEPVNNT